MLLKSIQNLFINDSEQFDLNDKSIIGKFSGIAKDDNKIENDGYRETPNTELDVATCSPTQEPGD